MQTFTDMEATILTGEQSNNSLLTELQANPDELRQQKDTRNICTDPGVGSDPRKLAISATNKQKLTTENLKKITKNTFDVGVALSILGTALITSQEILKKSKTTKDNKLNKLNVLKLAPAYIFTLGSAIYAGTQLHSVIDCKPEQTTEVIEISGRNPAVEKQVENEIKFEEFINTFDKVPVMGYQKGLIHVRNLEMAYHLWRVIAENTPTGAPTRTNILATYGNAHGKTNDLFLKGPQYLQNELLTYMRRITQVGVTYNQIIKDELSKKYLPDKNLSQEELKPIDEQWYSNVDSLTNYIRFFQETTTVGDSPLYDNTELATSTRPPSARTLMFREIIAEISKDDKNNGPYSSKSDFLKSALMVALAKDASIESQLNQTRANLQNVPRTEKLYAEINLESQPVLWFNQYLKNDFNKNFTTVDKQLLVGCVEIYGRMCPIVREFTSQEDKIIGIDKILLGNDYVGISKKRYIYSLNKPNELPEIIKVAVIAPNKAGKTDMEFFLNSDKEKLSEPTELGTIYWNNEINNDPSQTNVVILMPEPLPPASTP